MGKQQYLPHDGDIEIISDFDESPEETTSADQKTNDFASAMQDIGVEGEILVKLQRGSGKEPMEHVGYFQPDEYSYGQLLEHLQKDYGGGLYRIYLRVKGKNKGNQLVRIADKQNNLGDKVVPSQGGELAQTMQVIMDGMRRQNEMLAQMMHGGPSRSDMLDEMLKYKALFGGNDNQNNSSGLGMLKESVALLGDLGINVGGEKDSGFTELLDKMAPVIQSAVNNPPQTEAKRSVNTQDVFIKMALKQLLRAAKKNSEPGIYAQLILDQVPIEKVQDFFTRDDSIKKLYNVCPLLEDYKPWVESVIEHIKGLLGMESIYSTEYEIVPENLTPEEPLTETFKEGNKDEQRSHSDNP